ncbi:MAG: acyl carrier protein phosphodiesterase [Marivirga sp.]|jgi:acyl carrier protein phosphodiesterase
MNFLAHIYLSNEDEQITVGNFIGDFVKGAEIEKYDSRIKTGIILHRAIDEYTDTHPLVLTSKDKLRKKYRHYAGVILDIFFDHFLALNWNQFHPQPLRNFVDDQYSLLQANTPILPLRTQQMLPFMVSNDWLFNYQYFDGMQEVMSGMARRTKFHSKMEESVVELKLHHAAFEEDFLAFFPDLVAFSKAFLEKRDMQNS